MAAGGSDAPVEETFSANKVLQILEEKGLVDSSGVFVWHKSPLHIKGKDQVADFWIDEQGSFQDKKVVADDVGLCLPDCIMPTKQEIARQNVEADGGKSKKLKVWGPIQPIRQSHRIDRS